MLTGRALAAMNAADLMAKLIQIERAVGGTHPPVRAMAIEAEDSLLQLEQQLIESLRENELLRERMENCERFSQSRTVEDDGAPMELSGPLGVKRTRLDDPLRIN
jgi:hypothetical protein